MIGLVALSREVHGETFEITERAVKDNAGCAAVMTAQTAAMTSVPLGLPGCGTY